MEEALKTCIGVSGLFASLSISSIHEGVGLALAIATLIYMVAAAIKVIKELL